MKNLFYQQITIFLITFIAMLCDGCKVVGPYEQHGSKEIDRLIEESLQANGKLADSISDHKMANLLIPEFNLPKSPHRPAIKSREPTFDIVVTNVPAKDFFMGLVKDTKYNVILDPQIIGSISLELKSVTIPQAMDAVRDAYGFEYEITSYGYKIFPRRLETKIFHVNYIDIDRSGHSQTSVGSGQITNTIQNTLTNSGVSSSSQANAIPSGIVNTSVTSKFWELLQQNLEMIVGTQDGRSIVINSRSGSIIAKAYPDELRAIEKYLSNIQSIINRQVIIEARVLEIELNARFQTGINWKVLGLTQGYANQITTGSINENFNGDLMPKFNGLLHATATGKGEFASVIDLLNTQGDVNVLSSPRISTINNQKAVIKVGTDRFFVTNVTSNSSTVGNSSANTASTVTLTPFFSGISLDVTPQIDENDFVTIHIHPIVSQVLEDNRTFKVDDKNQELPLAKSTIKESDSVVRAKSGQIIVLGGLMESSGKSIQNSTPGTEKIPLVNGLFKNSNLASRKYELVILLRPVIVENTIEWQKQLQEAANNIKKNRDNFGYHIAPKINNEDHK